MFLSCLVLSFVVLSVLVFVLNCLKLTLPISSRGSLSLSALLDPGTGPLLSSTLDLSTCRVILLVSPGHVHIMKPSGWAPNQKSNKTSKLLQLSTDFLFMV